MWDGRGKSQSPGLENDKKSKGKEVRKVQASVSRKHAVLGGGGPIRKKDPVLQRGDPNFLNPKRVACCGAVTRTQPLLQTMAGIWEDVSMVD
jgi:hypothetical protein